MDTSKIRTNKLDPQIKLAIKVLKHNGRLHELAQATGIDGGAEELEKIANTDGDLSVMDRGMIGMDRDWETLSR